MRLIGCLTTILTGLALCVGGCSGFSSGTSGDSEVSYAGDDTGGGGSGGGGSGSAGSGWVETDDDDFWLHWWWVNPWTTGTCVHLQLYNMQDHGVELDEITLSLDHAVDGALTYESGGRFETSGSTLTIKPLPGGDDISSEGYVEFEYCAEPLTAPVSMEVDAHSTGSSGDDDDDDDDCGDDDDDDCDDEECFEYGELEHDGLFVVHMDAGYAVNCGDCLRLQVFTWGTETEYEDLTIRLQMTDGFELTYAEGFYWEHDDGQDEIVLGGLYDPDMGEFDVWDGRICVDPRVWPAAILELDYTSMTTP